MSIEIIEKAIKLSASGEDDQAIALLLPLVESGDLTAISNMGLIMSYYHVNGRYTKLNEGSQLLKEACDSGEASACHNLAELWLGNTPSLGKDLNIAGHLFLRARELGGPVADEAFYDHWIEVLQS